MKRERKVTVRLTVDELVYLKQAVKLSGLSQESYIRSLIAGHLPKAIPPKEFYVIIRELRAIGNNVNQMAMIANRVGYIETPMIENLVKEIKKEVLKIREVVTLPEKRINGNDCDMGRKG